MNAMEVCWHNILGIDIKSVLAKSQKVIVYKVETDHFKGLAVT